MQEIFVLRPAWIWDSRHPFHNFVVEHKRINRQFGAITLATQACTYLCSMPSNETRAVRQILHVDKGAARASRAWMMFRRGSVDPGQSIDPNRKREFYLNAVAEADIFMEQYAIVSYTSMFEVFILCWSLNYILAFLESCIPLAKRVLSLISLFSEHPRRLNAPEAIHAFPEIWEGLGQLPHVFTDRRTGDPIEQPAHESLNAREAILFWRAYRNSVVHNSGIVTDSFAERYKDLWELLRRPYGRRFVPMRVGDRLQFNDDMVRAVFTVHYRAAQWMGKRLFDLSCGRRGHLLAPEPLGAYDAIPFDYAPQPLLVLGDHPPSLRATGRDSP
jgi:hypothetical protein